MSLSKKVKVFVCDECGRTREFSKICEKHSGISRIKIEPKKLVVVVCDKCCRCRKDNG